MNALRLPALVRLECAALAALLLLALALLLGAWGEKVDGVRLPPAVESGQQCR